MAMSTPQHGVVSATARDRSTGLVLGGAAGNLADRVFRAPEPLRGEVVDFLAIGRSPIFNAADVGLVVGGVLTRRNRVTLRPCNTAIRVHLQWSAWWLPRSRRPPW
jgi:hypothetical protein